MIQMLSLNLAGKIRLALASLVALVALPGLVLADVQINLSAGYIRNHTGGTLPAYTSASNITAGGLLMFVAANSTTNTFTNALSAGQYVAGGDTFLAAFSLNNFGSSTANETTQNTVSFTLPTGVTGGTSLIELRWFPNITLAQYNAGATPSASTYFGAYNPSLYPAVNGSALNTDGGGSWVVPANGARAYTLNFFTNDNTDIAGSQPYMEGYANYMVSAVGVPEPSSGILGGLMLVVMIGAQRVHRKFRTA